jgi:DNA helicase-2/ATP-dependent DNA helicase PcrA
MELKDLNEEQKEAVTHRKGPLLIVAGAGTGKTTVITQRILYLIEKRIVCPNEILAVTFTEKAAEEMEERVDKALPYGYFDLWISTFHSFCEKVLRDYALDIGIPADFKILDQTSSWLFVYRNLDKFDLDYYKSLGNPTKFVRALISHFSHCKDQNIYPEDYLEYANKLKIKEEQKEELKRVKEVAKNYKIYQKLLLENSFLDFGDLINYCLKLFKERPSILEKYRSKFKYILVDEFQDTNFAQYELIKILSAPKNNLTVTADDDQSVYKWRGASFSNIFQFKKDFPKAKQVSLIKNYRSYQNVLDLGYKFIQSNNPDRLEYVNDINKKLVSDKKGKGEVEHIHAKTLQGEAVKTANKIIELYNKDKNSNYSDFSILVRSNSEADVFMKAFERAGLPYYFLASKGLYSKPVIMDIISYFRVLEDHYDSTSLYRVLSIPFFNIPSEDLAKINHYSKYKAKSLYEIMKLSLIPGVSKKTKETLNFILKNIKKHSSFSKNNLVSETMMAFLEDSGYLKHLTKKEDEKEIDIVNQFYKKVKSFEDSNMESGLNSFVKEIDLEIESGEEGSLSLDPDKGPEMIKIMTIHSAKGLEFKYVFLVNMVDRRFPVVERRDLIELPEDLIKDIKPKGDAHLQEERRICYVGITRAKDNLYFTSAEDYGGARKKKLSRFLYEMGYDLKKGEKVIEKKAKEKEKKKINFLPKHFSFSQFAAFQKCPLQYKFAFILKVPVKGKSVFSFGKTIHKVLYLFLKDPKDFSYLESLYKRNWVDEWYESEKQKKEYFESGKKIIRQFYKEIKENPPKILNINGVPALEIPFNLKLGKDTIFGKIDRIDDSKEGALIIAYKTGRAKKKLSSDDKEQLLIYQIAAEEVFGIKIKELQYHYLEENKKISFLGKEKEKENLKEKLKAEIKEIKEGNFEPTPGWQCKYCDFKNICNFAK